MRHHAIRQKVKTPFGSLYAEAEFDDAGTVRRVSIAHPSKHRDTAVGDALERLADAFNDLFADIRFTRAARSKAEVAAPPSAAACVSPVETGRDSLGRPGPFSHAGQGEQPFEGNGE